MDLPLATLGPPGPLLLTGATAVVLLALWLGNLVDCIRRERVPALLGSERWARRVWLASFLLLDPVQVLLYVLFVRVGVLRRRTARTRDGVVLVSLAGVAVLSLDLLGPRDVAREWTAAATPGFYVQAQAHVSRSSSTSSVATGSSGVPAATRRIRVIALSSHPLVAAACRTVCSDLAALPFVEHVEYRPSGAPWSAAEGTRAPDVVLFVDADHLLSVPLPLLSWTSGSVRITLQESVDGITYTDAGLDDRLVGMTWIVDGTLELRELASGLAWASARRGEATASVATWIDGLVQPLLEKREQESPPLHLPDAAFAYEPLDTPPVLARRNAQLHLSEAAPFVHDRSAWTFEAADGVQDAIAALQAELESDGWDVQVYEGNLQARRGDTDWLAACRPGYHQITTTWTHSRTNPTGESTVVARTETTREVNGGPGPIRVTLERRFTDDELRSVATQALEPDGSPSTALLLRKMLTPEQARALLAELVAHDDPQRDAWVQIAELAKQVGDSATEQHALERALGLHADEPVPGNATGWLEKRLETLRAGG